MLHRRDVIKGLLTTPWWASELYAQATRGLPALKIEKVDVIATSPRPQPLHLGTRLPVWTR